MKNFLRVLRMALSRRWTFVAAVGCSLGVAVLWGVNFGIVKPVIEIVFADELPHAWADAKVVQAKKQADATRNEFANVLRDSLVAVSEKSLDLKLRLSRLEQKLFIEEQTARTAETLRPLVKRFLPNNKFATLGVFIGLLLLATLIKDCLLAANVMLVERITQLAMFDLRNRLFRQTLRLEMARFGEGHSSHLMHRINADTNCVSNGVQALCGKMILEPLKMIACLVGAAFICWKLLAVSLLVVPLAAYILARLVKSLRKANRRAMEEMGRLYAMLSETLNNMQTVKAFGMEAHERRRYRQGGQTYYRRAMRISLFNALGRGSTEFMATSIICLAITIGAYLVIHQQTTIFGIPIMDHPLSLGSLMTFYALLFGASEPGRKISEVTGVLQRGLAAADRIYEILDYRPKIVNPRQPKSIANERPMLSFEKLSFSYAQGKPALNEIDLRIPFGETVAIVGPNGCGKSTLVNLLPRFYDPSAGAVCLDGIDLRELRVRDVRKLIGLVGQQAMLFDDTVLNNIRYGSPRATEAEVMEASEKAFAHRFVVERLEQGYETVVGERGNRLSGGQRQRLLLARAILRDPKFLILDEATSQIDLESEQVIHKVLERFVRGRTTLLITHRMSSIALANRIVVMEMGRIVDVGSHDELLTRCDLYSRLHHLGFRQAA